MGKKIPSYAKNFKDHKVILFDENNSVTSYDVYGIDNGVIETPDMLIPMENYKKYYDNTNGGFTYVFYLDLPARIEAENLKKLRRGSVINNLMKYDREKPIDIFKLLPWIICALALIFK